MKTITHNENETFVLAKKFAAELRGGEVIVLCGELGAGKTVFVKGLAAGLGIATAVTSPTFALMNAYGGRLELYHIDAYRLGSGREAAAAGLTEYFGREGAVCCVEWAENIADALPQKTIKVQINYLGEDKREIEIEQ